MPHRRWEKKENFASTSRRSPENAIPNSQKKKKNRILVKTRKINMRMFFILNLSCFVLSLDSSACLGNNILPDTLPPKTNDQKVISRLEQHHIFINL